MTHADGTPLPDGVDDRQMIAKDLDDRDEGFPVIKALPDVKGLVERFEGIVQKYGLMYADLDVAERIIVLIEAQQREIERLREFERRVTSEGMRNAGRYWEGRYRDEAAQLAAANRVKEEAVGLLRLVQTGTLGAPVGLSDGQTFYVQPLPRDVRIAVGNFLTNHKPEDGGK